MAAGKYAVGSSKKRVSGGERINASDISWIYYVDIALQLGLSVAEIDGFTPGMVTDLALTRLNQRTEGGHKEATQAGRAARQADYDAF